MAISLKPFFSIFSDTNKVKEGEQGGDQSTLSPELELSMTTDELLELAAEVATGTVTDLYLPRRRR